MRFAIIASAIVLAGCAGTTIKPVAHDAVPVVDDARADGIRYYEPAPFLLVYSDARGNLQSQIVMLPDTRNMRTVDPFAVLAKNNTTLTFSNGMLTEGKAVVDETVIPAQVLESVKAIAGTLVGAFDTPGARKTSIPSPKLFRILIKDSKVALLGGESNPPSIEVKFTEKELPKPAGGGQ